MNKSLKRRFKRARVFTAGIKDQYDIDLMDVSFHSKQNDGVKYLLVVFDVFTRYVWISPLQNKTGASVLRALEECFKERGPPRKVRSDAGKEFLAKQVQSYFKSVNIKHFVTQGESKSNYVERVIKTLRSLMHRFMKKARSFRYIDSLQTLVSNYNKTPHSSLGNKAPIEINEENEVDQIASHVRISHVKHAFEREFMEKYTGEIFTIKGRALKQDIPMYRLQDLGGEELVGSFYQAELQKVEKPEINDNAKNSTVTEPCDYVKWFPLTDTLYVGVCLSLRGSVYVEFRRLSGERSRLQLDSNLEGPLLEDVCRLDRFVLNGVDVNIKLYRQNPSFCLMSGEENPNYKIVFDDVIFRVCRIQVSPGIIVGHNKTLETTTAKYPLINTDVKLASIASGQTRFIWDNIYLSQCPSKIVVGLVSTEAQTGNYQKNPFNFQTFGATQVGVFVNNVSIPGQPYKIEKECYVSAYRSLFDIVDKTQLDSGNYIERDDWPNGYSLFGFCLQPQFGNNETLSLVNHANVRIEIAFQQALRETVSCILYAEFPSYFEIDNTRNVIVSVNASS
ncbi:uncharacterized protein LOC144620864 [Crassostrea virginica]